MAAIEIQVYDLVMAGDAVSAEQIVTLASASPKEGLHHDFKSGKSLDDGKDKGRLIWAIASFANADGGLLVIGVGEQARGSDGRRYGPRPLDPIPSHTTEEHDIRLAQVLGPIAQSLRPSHRCQVVQVEGGEVLLVAVPRAVHLVQAPHPTPHRQRGYPLRFGDGNIDSPEYLVSDLRLGRRERPEFEPGPAWGLINASRPDETERRIVVGFNLHNVGYTWIDGVRVFVVHPHFGPGAPQVPRLLREGVEQRPTDRSSSIRFSFANATMLGGSWPPLGDAACQLELAVPRHNLPARGQIGRRDCPWPWKNDLLAREMIEASEWAHSISAAVCVVVPSLAPRWFQLNVLYTELNLVESLVLEELEVRPIVSASTSARKPVQGANLPP